MLNYIYTKKGMETIIFLHGFGDNLDTYKNFANFFNSYNYSTLLIDFKGHGKSEKLERVYKLEDYVNDVLEVLDSLNLDNFYVVAHSFGGRVASILNKYYSIKKFVLTGVAGLKPKFDIKVFLKIRIYKIKKLLVKLKILNINSLKNCGSSDYKNLNNIEKQTFVNIVNKDLKNYYKNIEAKTLLFWGDNDKETPIYMAKKLNKLIKNSSLIIEKGSHFAFIENSFLFQNLVLDFLKGVNNGNI